MYLFKNKSVVNATYNSAVYYLNYTISTSSTLDHPQRSSRIARCPVSQ